MTEESRHAAWFDWAKEQSDPRKASSKPETLDDLLVLDVSYGSMGGLVCSSILSEMGARVIRVEPPTGDIARGFSPFGMEHGGTGLGYLAEGRNKYHITLNLEAPEGGRLFTALACRADILIETFRAGVMDGWSIGYRQLSALNPRLIYAALYTYGQFGPLSLSLIHI